VVAKVRAWRNVAWEAVWNSRLILMSVVAVVAWSQAFASAQINPFLVDSGAIDGGW
jgi:hypothetical protein